jgi:KipI family sensor histidine kinase inhibitor
LRVSPLGDAALYAEFGEPPGAASGGVDLETNAALQALAAALRARALPWVRDVVPALCGIAVHFDPDHPELPDSTVEAFRSLIEESLRQAGRYERAGRLVELPVCYDLEFGLDLEEIGKNLSLSSKDIVERHTADEHFVLMVGFSPGQPYLGGLDSRLALPRRATPRTRVPAGSVAIANAQSCVYSYETPGGWHVIGRTPLTVFDPARERPSLFAPGDRVRFVPVGRAEFERLR